MLIFPTVHHFIVLQKYKILEIIKILCSAYFLCYGLQVHQKQRLYFVSFKNGGRKIFKILNIFKIYMLNSSKTRIFTLIFDF